MTETAAINSKATLDSNKKLGVEKYEILATLDLKTSEICRNQDGKVYDLKDYMVGITAPPFHPNCRTTIHAFEDDIERNLDEKVGRMARSVETGKSERIENIGYNEWFNKYVEPYNDEKEYNDIVNILGYKIVENVEKYRIIKYNNIEEIEKINREVATIKNIDSKNWSLPYKQKVKDVYYEFKTQGHEFNMHGAERFIKHESQGKYTKEEVLEVLNKDFNFIQISDNRPVKLYNNIQVVYTKNGIEVHNIIKRRAGWDYKGRLKKYE